MRIDRALAGAGLIAISALIACIVPDRQIKVFEEGANEAPVRLIEPPPLSLAARCDCAAALGRNDCPETEDPSEWAPQCPLPDPSGLPNFLDDELPEYQFCSCAPDESDANRLNDVLFFAEDQDEASGQPLDTLYAALLLDVPTAPGELIDASEYVAYTELRDPTRPLDPAGPTLYERDVILRPAPHVRRIFVGDADGRIDLCNDAGPGYGPLSAGWHTVTLMVTDRPWFTRPVVDPTTGETIDVKTFVGIPDVASGATYDMDRYTFRCESEQVGDRACACEPDL